MKWGVSRFVGCRDIILAIVIITWVIYMPAYCQTETVVLLLEQSPVKGGEITPVAGIYHFAPGSEVTLTAVPKPGYQFVHWLGEVSDPTASNTVVYLDKPKVIIAVFEQTEDGISAKRESLPAGGGAFGGSLVPTAVDLSWPGGLSAGGGGGSVKPQPRTLIYVLDGETTPEVPEPATGVLLVLGGLFAFTRRGARRLA